MIIRPVGDYKQQRIALPGTERSHVDGLVYDMLNVSYKVKELNISVEHHFIQFVLNSNKVLQFIVDIETDSLLVMIYEGA